VPDSESAKRDFLTGRVAVVTGSTRGVGRAIAIELARAGANIVVHGRRESESSRETERLISKEGMSSKAVFGDLADINNSNELQNRFWDAFGKVDILINNAGADVLTGAAADWTFEQKLEHLWKVDVLGTISMSRFVGERMSKSATAGAIVNIGWDQAEQGMAGDSGEMFSTIKGAIMSFTRSLAQSLAPTVRVNCIAPGWIRTAWGEQASTYWQERAKRESLVERWGTPEDVAQAVCYVASPAAAFVTGQIINVNGGFRYGSKP
jgi:3-oxoacyl-[acyl-carrier protein] reductase